MNIAYLLKLFTLFEIANRRKVKRGLRYVHLQTISSCRKNVLKKICKIHCLTFLWIYSEYRAFYSCLSKSLTVASEKNACTHISGHFTHAFGSVNNKLTAHSRCSVILGKTLKTVLNTFFICMNDWEYIWDFINLIFNERLPKEISA